MATRTPPGTPRRDLLVSGHINVDHFLTVERFPANDRTMPILSQRRALGGTAANIARVTASYGISTGLLSRIGHGFPPEFWAALRADRLDLSGVERVVDRPTPACLIFVDHSHQQRTFIEQGPMAGPAPRTPIERIRGYSWLHLTTGNPEWHLAMATAARRVGVRVAADPAQEIHYLWNARTLPQLLHRSEILFGNGHEIDRAIELMGVRRIEDLLEFVPLVVVTNGKRGALAHSRRGVARVRSIPPRRVASLVGSGDAFRAGFYAGWFEGQPLEHCLLAGVRSATQWIEGRSVPLIVERASSTRRS
ncbi:MAG: PfkB family carbohydrate kinase [Thermoplasmata archaeon]